MAKEGEDTSCPMCHERMVYRLLPGPALGDMHPGPNRADSIPIRKVWQCDNCGYLMTPAYRDKVKGH